MAVGRGVWRCCVVGELEALRVEAGSRKRVAFEYCRWYFVATGFGAHLSSIEVWVILPATGGAIFGAPPPAGAIDIADDLVKALKLLSITLIAACARRRREQHRLAGAGAPALAVRSFCLDQLWRRRSLPLFLL